MFCRNADNRAADVIHRSSAFNIQKLIYSNVKYSEKLGSTFFQFAYPVLFYMDSTTLSSLISLEDSKNKIIKIMKTQTVSVMKKL